MNTNGSSAAEAAPALVADDRRQELTIAIKEHARGAGSKLRHPVRVRHAIECGQALTELKELLGPGRWTRWVEEQCALNRMTANRYMRLADGAHLLTPFMTIRQAYIAAGVIIPKSSSVKPLRNES